MYPKQDIVEKMLNKVLDSVISSLLQDNETVALDGKLQFKMNNDSTFLIILNRLFGCPSSDIKLEEVENCLYDVGASNSTSTHAMQQLSSDDEVQDESSVTDVADNNRDYVTFEDSSEPTEQHAKQKSVKMECDDEESVHDPDWNPGTPSTILVKMDGDINVAKNKVRKANKKKAGQFRRRYLVKDQVDQINDKRDLQCPECGKIFTRKWHRDIHYKNIHTDAAKAGRKPFECILCPGLDKAYKGQENLIKHVKSKHGKQYQCEECCLVFYLESQLLKHNAIKHYQSLDVDKEVIRDPTKPFQCHLCIKSFASRTFLVNHVKTQHSVSKQIKCNECPKAFFIKQDLEKHQKVHHSLDPKYLCTHCGKSYTSSTALKNHMLIVTGTKDYKCAICGKCYITHENLQVHIRNHTGEKPYMCSTCGKAFASGSRLATHKLTHLTMEQREHVCSVCHKRFARAKHLENHERIHFDDKPYQCSFCGKGFIEKHILTRHVRVHTGQKPYKCNTCGRGFSQSNEVTNHVKKTHMTPEIRDGRVYTYTDEPVQQNALQPQTAVVINKMEEMRKDNDGEFPEFYRDSPAIIAIEQDAALHPSEDVEIKDDNQSINFIPIQDLTGQIFFQKMTQNTPTYQKYTL